MCSVDATNTHRSTARGAVVISTLITEAQKYAQDYNKLLPIREDLIGIMLVDGLFFLFLILKVQEFL
jgi:hypothetical protein